ncbi:MAG: cache domain-containing protein, partial [Anaerotignum sp.]
MKSIQNKILVLIIPALLICTSLVGGVGVISAQRIIDRNTDAYMTVLCGEQSEKIESLLDRVEQSVDIMAVNALEELESAEALQQESYREAYTEKMRKMLVTTTEHTVGAVSVYLRYNPELTTPTAGIFMEKNRLGEDLRERRPTDLSLYGREDTEYAGWYYIPVEAGEPVWMGPYENKNIKIKMISYVVPLIKDGVALGVIGMDIDFHYITNQISKIRVYDGGCAYLIDEDDALVYHPALLTEEEIDKQNHYTLEGNPLKNGMKLVITV